MKKRIISLLLMFSMFISIGFLNSCYAVDGIENNSKIVTSQEDSLDKLENSSLIKESTLEQTTKPCEEKLDTNHFDIINKLKNGAKAVKNFVIKHRYKILALLTVCAGTYLAYKNYAHFLHNDPTADDTSTNFADSLPKNNPDDIVEMVKAEDHTSNIPIVMNIDNNGTGPSAVTISSICKNAKPETSYKFNMLVPNDFSDKNKENLFQTCNSFKNCEINIIKVNPEDEFKNPYTSDNIPKVAYFRLLSPQLLKDKNKVLYLDNDLIINNDLSDLFNIDLKSNYVSGVKDVAIACDNNYYKYYYKSKYGVKTGDGYINSGVLLMNLKKMREDGLVNKFRQFIEEHFELPMHDQDTINSICYNRILHLPFKFNVMNKYYKNKDAAISCLGSEEANIAFDHPEILHFSPQKPWNQNKESAPKEEIWWQYANDLRAI